jgi:hypothetical protein
MLIAISKNILVDPAKVSAIEQVEGTIWVWINNKPFIAEGYPEELIEKIETSGETKQFWAGK